MLQKQLITRRHALYLGLGALTGGAALCSQKLRSNLAIISSINPFHDFSVSTETTLAKSATTKGIVYGTAVRYSDLLHNPLYTYRIARECNIVVPEWELKWAEGPQPLRPKPDSFDFSYADSIIEFAESYHLRLRGHALVWHLSLPHWFSETVTAQNAEMCLLQHIQTVVGRYAGRMHSWDVVNEAIELNDGREDGLRKTPWLDFLGPDYIELAFRTAAAADPNALLVYNDYGLEYDRGTDEAKRTAVLTLLERLLSRGAPIHALGIQSHLQGDTLDFNPTKLQSFLSDIASLGLKILITELDVSDQKLPADVTLRDRIIASVYEDYLSVVLDEQAVIGIITWGLSDRYTWLSQFAPRSDGLPVRPLPLDEHMNRKLAWNAIVRAFDQAPKRK